MTKGLPPSVRKYIRKEKSRIRREFLDVEEQEKRIKELISGFKNPKNQLTKTTEKNKINIEKTAANKG
jgi:hypothetical protein